MQKRILVVRTDRVGDVVMITPLLRELRQTFPEAFLATLTNPNSADVLIGNPNLDKIIIDNLSKNSFLSTVKELRKHKFSDGLLLMPTERAAYQMFLAGIKNRIGVGKKLYEVITFMKSVSRNKYIPLRHEADYCMDLGRALGVVSEDLTPEIFISSEEKSYGLNLLLSAGVKVADKKFIVHTGSGKSSSNWSEKKYSELILKILNEFPDIKIILTAKEMSAEFRNDFNSLYDSRIIFIDNKLNRLRDLICIISNADLLIAASTGPLHVASALKVKTIGLYCHNKINSVKIWGALGNQAINLEVSKQYCDNNCSPDKETCNLENGISTDEVIKNIKP